MVDKAVRIWLDVENIMPSRGKGDGRGKSHGCRGTTKTDVTGEGRRRMREPCHQGQNIARIMAMNKATDREEVVVLLVSNA